MIKKLVSCLGLLALAGCVDGAAREGTANRIAVAEPNSLGVVALEIERSGAGADREVELRAVTVDHQTVAGVHIRSGVIPGLSNTLPGSDDIGSEIVFFSGDNQSRIVTRELNRFEFPPPADDRDVQELLSLEIARSTLAREANLIVNVGSATTDTSGDETSYNNVTSCYSTQLLVTPLAKQCCYADGSVANMAFVNPNNQVVYRYHRAGGPIACRNGNGSTCSGTDCQYGPFGYGAAGIATGTGYPRIESVWAGYNPGGYGSPSETFYRCSHAFYATPQATGYPDVTGVLPRGRGCCLNGAGPCGPGLQACTSCGGGGTSGSTDGSTPGFWDY
jgi:hypothetical protein